MAEVTSLKAGSRDLTSLNEEELRVALLHRMVVIRSELQKWSSTYSRVVHGSSTDVFRGQGKALALLAEQGEMLQREHEQKAVAEGTEGTDARSATGITLVGFESSEGSYQMPENIITL